MAKGQNVHRLDHPVSLAEVLERIQSKGLASSAQEARMVLGYLLKRRLLKPLKKGVARGTWSVYPDSSIEIVDEIAQCRRDKIPWRIVDERVRQIQTGVLPDWLVAMIQDSLLAAYLNSPSDSVDSQRFKATALWGARGGTPPWPEREWDYISTRLRTAEDREFLRGSRALAAALEPEASDKERYFASADTMFHEEMTDWLRRVLHGEVEPDQLGPWILLPTTAPHEGGTHATFRDYVRHRLGGVAWEVASEQERSNIGELWPELLRRRFAVCGHCGRFDLRLDRRRRTFCADQCRIAYHNQRRRGEPPGAGDDAGQLDQVGEHHSRHDPPPEGTMPRFPAPEVIRQVLRLAGGLEARSDAQGRALVGMITLLLDLAGGGHVRAPAEAGGTPVGASMQYVRSLPGWTTNPSRPTYYHNQLAVLERAGLILRDGACAPAGSSSERCGEPGAPEPRQRGSKLVLGTFLTVGACPDPLALAVEELGESLIEKLGLARTLATLAPRGDPAEEGDEPRAQVTT